MPLIDRITTFVARRFRRDITATRHQPPSGWMRFPLHAPYPQQPELDEPTPLQLLSDEVNERLRLATEIADDAARSEIELHCKPQMLGDRKWYDTLDITGDGPDWADGVVRALRYLDLCRRVQRHPVKHHLVRFAR